MAERIEVPESTSSREAGGDQLGTLVVDKNGNVVQEAHLPLVVDEPAQAPETSASTRLTPAQTREALAGAPVGEPVNALSYAAEVEGTGMPLYFFEQQIVAQCAAKAREAGKV